MKMEQVEVSLTSDGQIVITQNDSVNEDANMVFINKEQAALLCKWILSAAKESKNG